MTPIMSVPPPGIVAIQPVSEEEEMAIAMGEEPVIPMMPPGILPQVIPVLVQVTRLPFLLQITVTMTKIVMMEIAQPLNGGLPAMAQVPVGLLPTTLMPLAKLSLPQVPRF